MHIWDDNGHFEDHWTPYVFQESTKGEVKTIDGLNAEKLSFRSYYDYYSYCNSHPFLLENKAKPEIQYLAEKYCDTPDENIPTPKMLIYYLDIEVQYTSDSGFPHAHKAEHPVCLISLRNSINGHTTTFGIKQYSGNMENLTYNYCPDERVLLKSFFEFMHDNPPHVISGWNCWGFDLPYLINRDKLINNGRFYAYMSPIEIVRTWQSKKDNTLNIDIAGVTILDYMDIYKWYSPNNLERYSLEYVSQFELGKGKLDYSEEAEDLRELYDADWNKYVDYNVIDCKRVNDLGQKLGYIRLVQSLSLLTRVPMRYYNAMTSLIEGLMLTYYRRNGLCAPTLQGGSQETFEAAYVKEPQKGMHKWLFSIDIQSSYPSHIITLNMSTETYYGRIMDMSEDEIISYMQKKEFQPFRMFNGYKVVDVKGSKLDKFNEAFKRKLFSIAPCGTLFLNTKKGVLSTVERNVFEKRIEIKKLMRQSEGEERERQNAFQKSCKLILNGLYGATSVPYSRYFNTDISEAITSCGRYTIKAGEHYTNELLNKPNDELKTVLAELNK